MGKGVGAKIGRHALAAVGKAVPDADIPPRPSLSISQHGNIFARVVRNRQR